MEQNLQFKRGKYTLHGVLHFPKKYKKPSPVVVMFHGFTGNKSESHFIFTKVSRALAVKGIASFRFDFMGSGDSEGKFEDMTLHTEIKDAKKAVEFILTNDIFDKKQLGLLGLSMGAVSASFIASEYKTKSLVLWSPLAYPDWIAQKILTKELKEILKKNGKVYPPGLGHYLGKDFFESVLSIKPLEYAMLYRGNVLIIHTKDDTTLSLKDSMAYFEAFHKNAHLPRIIVLNEGGHTFTTEFSEKRVLCETVAFFAETLT